MNYDLLIIDSNADLANRLTKYLEPEGFQIQYAKDGEQGLKQALQRAFDVILLDISLPKLNGFEVLKGIREYSETPVVMLANRGDHIDRIVGLEIGADDYLSKPCNPRELIIRLRTILRRTQKNVLHKPILQFQHILVDCGKRVVTLAGTPIDLTNAEFNILEMLMKSPGQAFSKEELTEYALGRKYTAYDRSIDVHISNLRNKLGDHAADEAFIKTVRGFGYLFDDRKSNPPSSDTK